VGGGSSRQSSAYSADILQNPRTRESCQRMKERKEGMGLTWSQNGFRGGDGSDTPGPVTGPRNFIPVGGDQWPILFSDGSHRQGLAMLEQCGRSPQRRRHGDHTFQDPSRAYRREAIIRRARPTRIPICVDLGSNPGRPPISLKQISDESPTLAFTGRGTFISRRPFRFW